MSKSRNVTLRRIISALTRKPVLIVLSVFLFYLMLLPLIITKIVPCLRALPGNSFSWNECHVTLALDWYIGLALLGLGFALTGVFIWSSRPKYLSFAVAAVILTSVTILAYYFYIPHAEAQVRKAPIVLSPENK
jgi:hypothetical protein